MNECDEVESRANAVIDVLNKYAPTCQDNYVSCGGRKWIGLLSPGSVVAS